MAKTVDANVRGGVNLQVVIVSTGTLALWSCMLTSEGLEIVRKRK